MIKEKKSRNCRAQMSSLARILLWAIFALVALGGVYYFYKFLTGVK